MRECTRTPPFSPNALRRLSLSMLRLKLPQHDWQPHASSRNVERVCGRHYCSRSSASWYVRSVTHLPDFRYVESSISACRAVVVSESVVLFSRVPAPARAGGRRGLIARTGAPACRASFAVSRTAADSRRVARQYSALRCPTRSPCREQRREGRQ